MKKNRYIKEFASGLQIHSLRFFLAAVKITPRRVLDLVRQVLFAVAYPFMQRLRSICRRNLESVYADSRNAADYTAMAKGCLRYISQGMVDLLYFVQSPKRLLPITRIHNEAILQKALEKGRGVMAVTGHLGNFPLMFVSLVQRGYKVNVVIRPMRDKRFSEFMFDLCARRQVHMIPLFPRTTFMRQCLGALKRNELLFILLDEFVPEEASVRVDFFGKQVTRAVGPMLFHRRTGAPVLPLFVIKNNQGGFDIFIEPALEMEPGLTPEEEDRQHVARLTQIIEDYVRRYPLQWGGWLNKRWADMQDRQAV